MATSVQRRISSRGGGGGVRQQSLLYKDLSASPVGKFSPMRSTSGADPVTPGQATAVATLWRESFNASELPPPPLWTLEDRVDHSPITSIGGGGGESFSRSPDIRFDDARSPSKSPLSATSGGHQLTIGFPNSSSTPSVQGGGSYAFGSPSQRSPKSPNWWSPLKERNLDLVLRRNVDADGSTSSPVSGVVQQSASGLLTLPTLREIVQVEPPQRMMGTLGNGSDGDEWVTVFGFGPDETNAIMREFEKCGTIMRHVLGPNGANWIHIQFQNGRDAQKALLKNGMQLNGALIVGVKPLDAQQKQALADKPQRSAFMVLPPTPAKETPSASARPYYLQTSGAPQQSTKIIASPVKSTFSKIVDLVFGL